MKTVRQNTQLLLAWRRPMPTTFRLVYPAFARLLRGLGERSRARRVFMMIADGGRGRTITIVGHLSRQRHRIGVTAWACASSSYEGVNRCPHAGDTHVGWEISFMMFALLVVEQLRRRPC